MTAARQANIVCRIGRLRRVTNHNGLLFYRYRYVKRLQAALCLPSKRRALRQFTKQLKGKARHGDPKDAEDYVVEMYNVSYEKEKDCSAKPYLKFEWYFKTRDLTEKMRSILVDWLVDVHNHYSSQPETLYLTVNILDRFLERKEVEPRVLQLAGAASFLIATKYEEELPVTAADMVWISDNIYTNVEVIEMEHLILEVLNYRVTIHSPYRFMVRLLEVSKANAEFRNIALMRLDETLLSLDLLDYLPSQLAAGAFAMAGEEVGSPSWDSTMVKCSRYSKAEAMEVAVRMKQERVVVPPYLSAIQKKYGVPRR